MEPAVDRRRLLIAAIAGGLALLLLIGVGVYGLLLGPAPSTDRPQPTTSAPAEHPTSEPDLPSEPEQVPVISDPEVFVREVATALFTWDTTGGYGPADYAQVLVDVADSEEAAALAADVRGYLPTPAAWAQLRQYQTRQRLTIDTVVVPEEWATAQTQAAPGQIPPGTIAYTITGTRHRTGVWGTEPVEASRSVAFTVFFACTPPAPEFHTGPCQLLRLSQLDNPLR